MTMSSANGIVSAQPVMVLPKVTIDPDTKAQTSPQSPPHAVDSALLELIQSVQHELRTPVHGMLALITALTSDMRTEIAATGNEQRVSDINALAAQLLSILDDFRDYASHTIEAKVAEQNHDIVPDEDVNLSEVLDDIAADVWDQQVRSLQAAKGPDVRIPPPPELILTLDTSLQAKKSLVCADSFQKVARKLIDNAMKFTTGEGYVDISLAPHRMQDVSNEDVGRPTRDYLRLSVEDTGAGMTTSFVNDQLFSPFAKADKFKSGAGLSMALCSSLVRKMGGSMQVSSDEGRGTTVIVLIPVTSQPQPEPGRLSDPSSPDELVFFWCFDGLGLQRLAGSIASQLATFGNLYTTTKVAEADYILLPEEVCYGDNNEGLEALMAEAKEGVKVGVLQAHKDAKIELTATKMGSPPPVYVTRKPFGPRSFARLIQLAVKEPSPCPSDGSNRISNDDDLGTELDVLQKELQAQHVSQPHGRETQESNHTLDLVFPTYESDQVLRSTPPAARTISPLWEPKPTRTFSALCVEDNALNMRILTRVLSQCGVPFSMAVDGVEAVEQFEQQQSALVLLDINMPRMDGYEACMRIRKAQHHATHIIAITALSDDFSRRKGLEECGMDEWLSKPLNVTHFRDKIKAMQAAFQQT